MSAANANARLEAFCDGVFAIALTLLIIDLKLPHDAGTYDSARDLWLALRHLDSSLFAFLLSFGIVLITWVNHHEALKLVDKSSTAFVYANGFLLLTIVVIPFPTRLVGETLFTNHPSPAVVLYSATDALQAVGWWLVTRAGLPLCRSAQAAAKTRAAHRDSYFAFVFYSGCAVIALWAPLTIAVVITVAWIVWLIYGLSLKEF